MYDYDNPEATFSTPEGFKFSRLSAPTRASEKGYWPPSMPYEPGMKSVRDGSQRILGPERLEEREIEFYEGGELVHAKGKEPVQEMAHAIPARGVIRKFSSGSRRRMMQSMAKIDKREVLPNFLTVTYGEDFPTSAVRVKRDLDVFGKALRREYPGICFFWRMEFQKRGAPHLHFLIWGGPVIVKVKGANIETFHRLAYLWVQTIDGTCKELDASTRYERIESDRGVYFYLSKYLAKVEQSEGSEGDIADLPGRFWGVIGRERLADLINRVIVKVHVWHWMEFKNRLAWILKENGYSHVKAWGPWMGLSAYLNSASVAGILRGLGLLPGGVHGELKPCPF